MTARRRIAPLLLVLAACIALGAGLTAGFAHTPDIAVVDVQLPTLSIEGN